MKQKIPKFKNEAEERAFWKTHDSADYLDWSQASHASFVNLKPTTKTISLRIPMSLLLDIKTLANKNDVPYQSYMKILLSEKINELKRIR